MTEEHARLIEQAAAATRAKRFDDARELALRVLREDGTNTKALWIVASVTASLNERRNALNQLLRLQPDNSAARQMLDSIDMRHVPISGGSSAAISSSAVPRTTSQPVYLYAVLASLVLIIISTLSAAFIF